MRTSGTEATRSQIQASKPKRGIMIKRTYGQPSELIFSKRLSLSNPNRTNNNMNTRKVKRHRNSKTKNRQQRITTKLPPWNPWGLKLVFLVQPHYQFLKWYKTFSLACMTNQTKALRTMLQTTYCLCAKKLFMIS